MIVYGKQIALYILQHHPDMIQEVLFSKQIDKKLFSQFAKLNKPITVVDNKKAQSLAKGGNHQGFFLDIQELEFRPLKSAKSFESVLILDEITDVGNIGAIIRTAYSFGYDAVILTGVQNINMPAVIRSSSGAALDIPLILMKNPLDVVNELKQFGFTLYGAHMQGIDLKDLSQVASKYALIMGSEGRGLHPKLMQKLDTKVSIGMANQFDSLNVSVAAGVLMYSLGTKK